MERPVAEIFVAGAGVVGLTLAIALARAGLPATCLGPVDRRRDGRTLALLDGSVRMLTALEVWPRVAAGAAPLATMRIVDATASLFRGPPVAFDAAEIGLAAFGYNVENAALLEALEDVALATPGLRRIDGRFVGSALRGTVRTIEARTAEAADGEAFDARLLVAADGAASAARAAAGIGTREHAYPQTALTMLLGHSAPHHDVSTEFHTSEGPFTLVPMPPATGRPHRSSLVWVMAPVEADRRLALTPAALAVEIEARGGPLLGRASVEGAVGRFPIRRVTATRLIGPRIALVGEAAHALPPIGAQGLNLSLRDVATLVDILAQARRRRLDPGGVQVLEAYERARAGDVALRGAGVDALNRSLLSSVPPVDGLRGVGLSLLARMPAARRALMRHGLRQQHAIPTLMR